jgi:hypothetical protein
MKNNEIKYFSCQTKGKEKLKILPLSNWEKKNKKSIF